jgi:hypothetical protein
MKTKRMLVSLILVGVTLACSTTIPIPGNSQTSLTPGPEIIDVMAFPFEDATIFGDDLQPDMIDSIKEIPLADIYHLEVILGDDLLSLNGKMKVRYFNRLEMALEEVYFRLLPNLWGDLMQVSNVTVNGSSVTPELINEDTALHIPLTGKVPSAGHVDIGLNFTVSIPQDGSSNYGTFAYQDGTLTLAQFYPLIPLRDESGWRIEVYPPSGDVTVTESANYLVNINAPENLLLAASGVRLGYESTGGRQIITQAVALSREFYLAGSEDYRVQTLSEDDILYAIYSRSSVAATAKTSLAQMAEAVRIFSAHYGAYPYREIEIVATPTSAGGVEYPGIFAINQILYVPGETLSGMRVEDLVESVVVHEVAHAWFYNVVGNDQGREPWLDEALAQYMTWQYFQERYGQGAGDALIDSFWSRWSRVDLEPIPIGLPVEAYQDREYGAIVYGRGPLFLLELSQEMGQVKFDLFLRDYFDAFRWKVATSQDFQELAETTCGCDLGQLFNEWVYIE